MTLNELKLRSICKTLGPTIMSNLAKTPTAPQPVSEGADEGKPYQTPKFVRDCVSAISEKPKTLSRISKKEDGSPFAVCYAKYNNNKKSLAATHSKGEHHSNKDFEAAKSKLRNQVESLRKQRSDRRNVVFEGDSPTRPVDTETTHRDIVFRPAK